MPLNQLKNLLVAVLLASACAWAVQWIGPLPATKQVHARSSETTMQQSAQPAPTTGCPASAMPGALASGQETQSAQAWLDSLESRYRARGFQRLEIDPNNPMKPPVVSNRATKFYWRTQIGGQWLIGATGEDADPRSEARAAEAQSFVTVATTANGGGSQWMLYNFDTAAATNWLDRIAAADGANASGHDAADIPLHPGMQRAIGFNPPSSGDSVAVAIYSSAETPDALQTWYREQMQAAGWQFDQTATAQAGAMADGMLCFARAGRGCLIWIAREGAGGHTTVTIGTFNR
jgi:hypothetical protein